ncbi:MAG: hypothetical protein PHR83_10265 [Paludibacter sp.]|nr:hypothetical protein [Paludibacter sp.]
MNIKLNKKVEEFLVSDSFVNYVIEPTTSLIEVWEKFFKNNPDQIPYADEAKRILLGEEDFIPMPAFEALAIKMRIFEECNISVMN